MAILQQSMSGGEGPISGWDIQPCRPGQYLAICLDVKDTFGVQRPKYDNPAEIETLDVCRFLFGTQDGQLVQTGEMKISAHEKSKLVGVLTSWTGQAQGAGFDTETLKGKGCMINVVEKTSQKGRKYADITSITPVMTGMEAQIPQASHFTIPGESAPTPAPVQNVAPTPVQQPVQQQAVPVQTATTVTVEQPQPVQQTMGQQFTAPNQNVPF